MSKTILITGGCGYVGSRVATRLVTDGFEVIVADKATPEERGVSFPDSVEIRIGDLREPENCKKALVGADIVLHLASNIGPLTYMHEHQAEIMQENMAIDSCLYPAIIENGGIESVVYSSSSMIYQHAPKYPYTEVDAPNSLPPTNVYGFSKLAGEYFCKSFQAQHNLPYVIIRYHNIYGPGEDSKGSTPGDIHVIPALIEKVLKEQYPLELLGDPEATRPFTYVDDAIDATVKIVKLTADKNEKVLNNDFNIGNKEHNKIVDLAKIIWGLLGDDRPFEYKQVETKAITAKRRELDPSKVNEIIGWEPQVSLEEGIEKTAEWIKNR